MANLKVFQSTYCKDFRPDDISTVEAVVKELIESVRQYRSSLLNKPKFHLLLHLPQNMLDFGPPSVYNTERYMYTAILNI